MRRYDVKFISMEDYGALKRLIRKKRATAMLVVVTPADDWPATTRMVNGGKRRIKYDTIN